MTGTFAIGGHLLHSRLLVGAVPVVVDAGLGVPSDAAEAMEVGADAVLVNTAIAVAHEPVTTRAGRLGQLTGAGPVSSAINAAASSPLTGFLGGPDRE